MRPKTSRTQANCHRDSNKSPWSTPTHSPFPTDKVPPSPLNIRSRGHICSGEEILGYVHVQSRSKRSSGSRHPPLLSDPPCHSYPHYEQEQEKTGLDPSPENAERKMTPRKGACLCTASHVPADARHVPGTF